MGGGVFGTHSPRLSRARLSREALAEAEVGPCPAVPSQTARALSPFKWDPLKGLERVADPHGNPTDSDNRRTRARCAGKNHSRAPVYTRKKG